MSLHSFPQAPTLGGGTKVRQWLLSMAESDEKKGANARAREARAIVAWITEIVEWYRAEAGDAQ